MRCSACKRKAIGPGIPDGFGGMSGDHSVREVMTRGPEGSVVRVLLCAPCVRVLEGVGYECTPVPPERKT